MIMIWPQKLFVSFYVNITNADYLMSDVQSLENVGVKPDELLIPSGEDLAAKRDVVMLVPLRSSA